MFNITVNGEVTHGGQAHTVNLTFDCEQNQQVVDVVRGPWPSETFQSVSARQLPQPLR